MKFRMSIVGLLCMGLTYSVYAEGMLPQGWSSVEEPSPAKTTCRSCSAKAGKGISENPSLQDNGTLLMNVDLADISPVKQFALKLQFGSTSPFSPSNAYQILTGEKDSLTAKLGGTSILFKTSLKELGVSKVYSLKYPDFSISKSNEKLILSNDDEEFLFSSKDSGSTWQLAEIRHRDCAKRNIGFEYNREGLMTALVLPDGHKYTLEYQNGHVAKVNDPAGSVSEIIWDESRIKAVKTTLLPEHPFYVKGKTQFNTVRDIQVEYDNKGRILNVISTNGEKFSAEYREEKAPAGRSFITILAYPDGSEKFAKLIINDFDGTKKTEIGYIGRSEKYGVKTFVAEKEVLMKKKGSSFVTVSKTTNGAEVRIGYNGNNTEMMSKTDALGRKTSYEYDNMGKKTCVIYPDNGKVSFKYDDEGRITEMVREDGAPIKYTYNGTRLINVNDSGLTTFYEYDSLNRPIRTVMSDGTVYAFEWDNLFRLSSYTRPDGVRIEYTYAGLLDNVAQIKTISSTGTSSYSKKYAYDTKGRLAKITYPDATSESFAYDCCSLVKYADKAGAVTKYAYDAGHRKVLEISPNNEKTSFAYDTRGLLVKTTYPNKTTLQHEYDKFGKLLKAVKPDGTWEKYAYDVVGNKISMEKSNGLKSEYVYDERDRLISIKGEAERNIEYVYDQTSRVIETFDHGQPYTSNPRKTMFIYDNAGRLVKTIHPDGTSTIKSYHGHSSRLSGMLSTGIMTHFQYDSAGQLVLVSKSAERSNESYLEDANIHNKLTYDMFGNLSEIRNGEGRLVFRYMYNSYSKLQSILIPVSSTGAIKQSYFYQYDSDGIATVSVYRKLVTNPSLAALDYNEEYDSYMTASLSGNSTANRLGKKVAEYALRGKQKIYSINELGQKAEYEYNDMGQLIKLLVDGSDEITYSYDSKGRAIEREDILDRTFKDIYDIDNNLKNLVQPNGVACTFDYDKYGRVMKQNGAGAYPFSYTYTPFGEIDSYVDSNGAKTKFIYDEFGKISKRIWPDGSETVYKHNERGFLVAKEEAGRVTGYIYDDMNRLIKANTIYGPESIATELTYDKKGQLTKITDGKTAVAYQYDDFGRVISEEGPVGTIRYSYNQGGLLSAKFCKFNGKTEEFVTKYSYDEFNRVNKVFSPAGTYTYEYDRIGRIESLGINNKVEIRHAYDKAGRLLSKTVDDELLCKYEYDNLDRRMKSEINGVTWTYGYDQYNQIISAKANSGELYDYSYDGIGNRVKFNQIAMAYNKLNQITVNGYQYDQWGNLIQTPEASYKYDVRNRLIEVKKSNLIVQYNYDPLGQRIETTEIINGIRKVTKYLMSGMVEQARSSDVVQWHTIGLDSAQSLKGTGSVGAVLATTSNNISFNYLYDGNGNVIASCDSKGQLKDRLNYSPFGEQLNGSILPFSFSTKAVDASGLSYYGYRFYNAALGRWLNRDPIKELGGVNIYSMCSNTSGIDYCGLNKICFQVIVPPDLTIKPDYENLEDGILETDFEELVRVLLAEAGIDGMEAVAAVIVNRFQTPEENFGSGPYDSYSDVIQAPGQFDGFDTNDSTARDNAEEIIEKAQEGDPDSEVLYNKAVEIANKVMNDPSSINRTTTGENGHEYYPYSFRTEGASSPGGRFRKIGTVAGNTFYYLKK